FPVLQAFGLRVHIFLVTGLIGDGPARQHEESGGRHMFSHRECETLIAQGRADDVMLRWSEVREMSRSGLVEFHLHTHTHRRWDLLDNVREPSVFLESDILLGQAMKEALQAAGCTNTIRVVSPGFDFDAIREAMSMPLPEHVREWLEARAPHPVIVQIGMLRPEKGHDFMLKTLFHLKREGGQFHWLIVGGGAPEEESLLRRRIVCTDMWSSYAGISGLQGGFPDGDAFHL
ncbi:polysaccharide deacetylase family protein, partial [Escherichia coli]|nr:polysaccharide deacetylase family protein [Escherichia coli]